MFYRIKEMREETGIRQKELARILYCAQQTYSNYEKQILKIPVECLVDLAALYETSVDYLLGLTDVRDPYPKSKRKQFDE